MDYKIVKYSEIGKIRSGKRLPKGYTVSEKISDNKYIRVRDINSGSIDSSIVQYITDEAAEKLERYKVKTRDVIISVVGTVGAIAQIDKSLNGAYLTENCDNLQVDESLCLKDYLKYYLLSEDGSKEIIANTVGSTQPKLPIYGIENFNIKLPSIDNQKRMIKLLNSIDKKIKLNNEINNNLYDIGCNIYNKQISKNEYHRELKEFFKVLTGKKDANASRKNGIYPFFTCSKQTSKIDEYSFDTAAILLAGNGDFNVKVYKGKFDAYQRTYVLIPKNEIYLGYLYFAISENLLSLTSSFRGSVIKFITKGMIENYKIPSIRNTNTYECLNNLIEKIMKNNDENEALSKLRNTLLPKLMNGEINLDNIEI